MFANKDSGWKATKDLNAAGPVTKDEVATNIEKEKK